MVFIDDYTDPANADVAPEPEPEPAVEDAAAEPEPETAAAEPEPAPVKDHRPRGGLEADVKAVTDKFVSGDFPLPDGQHLTPHRIAKAIQEEDALDKPPSPGAVSAVLVRWGDMGFANINQKPLAFSSYTPEGSANGLAATKAAAVAARKAAKAEAAAAAAPPEPAPEVADYSVEPSDFTPHDGTFTEPPPVVTAVPDFGG